MLDLLVIGAGCSGLSAALVAAQAGLRVRVIAKGLGTLHWHAGTLDVLGYLPGDTPESIPHPFAALDRLPAQHPYARLGAAQVEAAMETIVASLNRAGLDFGPSAPDSAANPAVNLLLPSPIGVARPTWRAPRAQRAGELTSPQPMLIVGFSGLRDFYPALIAEHISRAHSIAARADWLPLATITHRRDNHPVHLAQALDDPATVARLGAALKAQVDTGERIGLPAILGLERHAATLAQLEAETGASIFEIPTLPPSVPGIRLHKALVATLAQLGVRVEAGMAAIAVHQDGDVIHSVETATSSRPLRHRARAFLLATGGILGGGLQSDAHGRVWESVFDLPVSAPTTRQGWFRSEFLDPRGQPIFRGGLEVNDQFQPITPEDSTGAPLLHNVWVAGNALAHADAIRTRSVEGLAIATGVAAAHAIIASLGSPPA
ncbi:MAG: anaerobic glycerol-3-phosphate dehydrogenase subunit GlpB [Litorilinea sp.]